MLHANFKINHRYCRRKPYSTKKLTHFGVTSTIFAYYSKRNLSRKKQNNELLYKNVKEVTTRFTLSLYIETIKRQGKILWHRSLILYYIRQSLALYFSEKSVLKRIIMRTQKRTLKNSLRTFKTLVFTALLPEQRQRAR